MSLLQQALTHCSASADNNERFEFLGDSILSFVIAHALFKQFPHECEGQLSRLRAFLVKKETLAEVAIELQLGDYLYLGPGELRSGGFRRASILADTLEAVIAAVFLDGGIVAGERLILDLYQSRLAHNELNNNLKDAKTQLQEFLQAKKLPLPIYTLIKTQGEEHAQQFELSCTVSSMKKTTAGTGSSRRQAEQESAQQMLLLLKK